MFDRLKSRRSDANAPAATEPTLLLNVYATSGTPPAMIFAHHVVAHRDLNDAELWSHLQGFIGYVLSRGDGQMTRTRYHLMRHLQRVQSHLSVRIKASALPAFEQWAMQANAVMFWEDGSVRDPQGRVLIDGAGQEDPAAELPYPADTRERKARTETALAQRNIQVLPGLPPVIGETEVRWRLSDEVAGRAMALLVVAVYAESVRNGSTLGVAQMRERLPEAFEHLSPKEEVFLYASEPDQDLANQLGWRYESLALLAWALGVLPQLPWPDQICDVSGLCAALLAEASPQWRWRARLRPSSEILNALDLHYRLHWLVREAQLGRRELPDGLIPGVVLERHYALNWLVHFEQADWDDVDTPT